MRRKAVSRKRVRDESSSAGKSAENHSDKSRKNEDETKNSKLKKTDSKNKDIFAKDLQVMIERCDDSQEKEESGETSESSIKSEDKKAKSVRKVVVKGTKRKKGIKDDDDNDDDDDDDDDVMELPKATSKDETENSDVPVPSRRDGKKVASVKSKQSTLDKFKFHSKASETKSKKTENPDKDTFEKDLQVTIERCDDSHEKEESGETSESSIKSEDKKAQSVRKVTVKGTKRKKGIKGDDDDDDDDDDVKPPKSANKEKQSGTTKKASKKEQIPDVTLIDFNNESKSPDGNPWNFKISSWNVNGIRAWLEKNGHSFLVEEKPDILCVQETKCSDDKLPEEMKKVEDYHTYWLSGDKDGYSGVGLLSKKKPISVKYGIDISEHDNEGRVITAEYEDFYLVAVYVPNAGRGLVRLEYRQKWDEDFRAYLKKLDAEKPVILCGDLNVAHEEIDLANPKTNKKNAGFTKEEREGFSTLLEEGFVDSFRRLYPDETGAYTFWTYMMNARAKNVGWRLDYFVLSERLCDKLCDNVIRKDVFGSDHCPITLFLSL